MVRDPLHMRMPFQPHFRTKRWLRRLLVVLLYAGVLAYAIPMTWLNGSHSGWAAHEALFRGVLGLATTGIVAAAVGFAGLMIVRSSSEVVNAPDEALDERLVVQRNRALAIAFRIMALVCTSECVVWAWRNAAMQGLWGSPLRLGIDLATPFVYGDAVLALTLPMSVFAWIEPDPIPEE